jgi:acetylornithine deacetylase
MFAELIAIPSVSSIDPRFDQGNIRVVECLANWLTDLGFHVEIMPLPDRDDKVNLVASLGKGGAGLVLSGHTDTVPYDEGNWNSDPFKLTERDGRLYGLGSADMKCFFPLVIEALRTIDLNKLTQPLTILATADEESSMAGARALQAEGKRLGRYAVIGEPTGLKPIRLHKGILQEAIHLYGHTGHASNPALGNNAIEGMHKVIGSVLAWRNEMQQRHHDPQFEVPFPTVNLGNIHGGDSPNRICGHCALQIDLRLLPGMPFEETRAALASQVMRAIAGTGLRGEVASIFDGVPPLDTDPQSAIVKITEQLTGHAAGSVAFATEGPFFNALGMETVVLGPGDIAQAHQPDEYVALQRLQPMIDIITKLIGRFCLTESTHGR